MFKKAVVSIIVFVVVLISALALSMPQKNPYKYVAASDDIVATLTASDISFGNSCEVDSSGKVSITGSDAYIVFGDIDYSFQTIVLNFEKTSSGFFGQVYIDSGNGFSEFNSYSSTCFPGDSSLVFPTNQTTAFTLRVDVDSEYVLESVELHSEAARLVSSMFYRSAWVYVICSVVALLAVAVALLLEIKFSYCDVIIKFFVSRKNSIKKGFKTLLACAVLSIIAEYIIGHFIVGLSSVGTSFNLYRFGFIFAATFYIAFLILCKDIISSKFEIVLLLLIMLGFLALCSANWYVDVYGDIGFESILFTLFSNLGGAEANLVNDWMLKALLPAALYSSVIVLPVMFRSKLLPFIERIKLGKVIRRFPLKNWVKTVSALVLCVSLLLIAGVKVGIPDYIDGMLHKTTIYEDEYVDPDNVNISFPEQKRNLIYIYLESMETSYLSKDLGGAFEHNLIPELYSLANENVNFSHNDGVGGWPQITNTTWTVAAMVGQSAGIPLSIPIDANGYGAYGAFLPGVTTINDILSNEGYYQAVMFGSHASFGGRDKYYRTHGIDRIYDYTTAADDGIIEEGYLVWWGFEDLYLFEYAKQELMDISAKNQPFSFTMLTVDTHHISGYRCEQCGWDYPENYENVISCSSKQVYAFVEWIKQQDFYENTTIVICGDHKSMDVDFFERNVGSEYERYIYNCFVNSAISCDNTKNKEFSTMDIFPTTLAAMGCEIEGERLGFGVNLFSDEQTLCEKYGTRWLNEELSKSSAYYLPNFVDDK